MPGAHEKEAAPRMHRADDSHVQVRHKTLESRSGKSQPAIARSSGEHEYGEITRNENAGLTGYQGHFSVHHFNSGCLDMVCVDNDDVKCSGPARAPTKASNELFGALFAPQVEPHLMPSYMAGIKEGTDNATSLNDKAS